MWKGFFWTPLFHYSTILLFTFSPTKGTIFMATFKTFEEIGAWQEGRALVKAVYATTAKDPFASDYGLKDQIRRAAISICSNIAEGYERRGNKEFIKFLWIAKGSAAEVASQLNNALDLGYLTVEQFASLESAAKKIAAMLYRLIASIADPERQHKLT